MALIKCPECGKEISDNAITCIHCGFPLQEMLKEANSIADNTNADKKYKVVLVSANVYLQDTADFLQQKFLYTKNDARYAVTHLPVILGRKLSLEAAKDIESIFLNRTEKIQIIDDTSNTDNCANNTEHYTDYHRHDQSNNIPTNVNSNDNLQNDGSSNNGCLITYLIGLFCVIIITVLLIRGCHGGNSINSNNRRCDICNKPATKFGDGYEYCLQHTRSAIDYYLND